MQMSVWRRVNWTFGVIRTDLGGEKPAAESPELARMPSSRGPCD
jgi:hypothetical protein